MVASVVLQFFGSPMHAEYVVASVCVGVGTAMGRFKPQRAPMRISIADKQTNKQRLRAL